SGAGVASGAGAVVSSSAGTGASSVGSAASSAGGCASMLPVSSPWSAAAWYWASSALASSPTLDHELRLQEERCGSIPEPACRHVAHDQLERAQAAFSVPVATLHEERVRRARSIPARLAASIRRFGERYRLAPEV